MDTATIIRNAAIRIVLTEKGLTEASRLLVADMLYFDLSDADNVWGMRQEVLTRHMATHLPKVDLSDAIAVLDRLSDEADAARRAASPEIIPF